MSTPDPSPRECRVTPCPACRLPREGEGEEPRHVSACARGDVVLARALAVAEDPRDVRRAAAIAAACLRDIRGAEGPRLRSVLAWCRSRSSAAPWALEPQRWEGAEPWQLLGQAARDGIRALRAADRRRALVRAALLLYRAMEAGVLRAVSTAAPRRRDECAAAAYRAITQRVERTHRRIERARAGVPPP